MKRIDPVKQDEVIRLFFYGYSYDEIVERLDIAKGSVVNFIGEFKDGTLPVPPDLMMYIDGLRHVAVGLKKLHTNVAKMKSCLRLHSKLLEMKVNDRDIERWLDICQSIANPSATNEQFVGAALELAKLTKEKGLSYDELIHSYDLKLKQLNDIEDEIEGKRVMLQLKEAELRELQSVIKEHVVCAVHYSQHTIEPIILHSSPSRHCSSDQVDKCSK